VSLSGGAKSDQLKSGDRNYSRQNIRTLVSAPVPDLAVVSRWRLTPLVALENLGHYTPAKQVEIHHDICLNLLTALERV